MQPKNASNDPYLSQLETLQDQLQQAGAALAETEVTGIAGEGAVRVTLAASGQLRELRLDPRVVDRNDVARLERLIMEAHADASDGIQGLAAGLAAPLSNLAATLQAQVQAG